MGSRVGEERKKLGMEDGIAKVQKVLRHLPHDLIVDHILTRLPIRPLIQFKCVSKQWYSDISSYQFAQNYSKLSLFSDSFSPTQYLLIPSGKSGNNFYLLIHDDDDISSPTFNVNQNLFELRINFLVQDGKLVLIGSCNGLVCLASSSGDFFILWNPITGIFRKYSDLEFPIIDSSKPLEITWGFGYVFNVDDFKVIRILEVPATLEIRVDAFSLKSNKWTRIADHLYQTIVSYPVGTSPVVHIEPSHLNLWYLFTFPSSRGVLINETYYWIVYNKMDGLKKIILSFDLDSEEFDAILDLDLALAHVEEFLCNIGGCLSKYRVNMPEDVPLHMLKYPGKESIQLSEDLPVNCCEDLVGSTRTSKFFIHFRDSVVGILDPTSEPMKYTQLALLESSGRELSRINALSRTSKFATLVPSLTFPYTVEECSGNHNALHILS